MKKLVAVVAFTLVGLAIPSQAASYKVDSDHSQVMFKVRHLLGKVTGRFDKFEGTFDFDGKNPKAFKAKGTIPADSINTNNAKRDEHLKSADFFDVKTYPTLSFVSKEITSLDKMKGKMKGDLTIRGVTKPVVFDVEFLGEAKDPWGNQRSSVNASTTIHRSDFGVAWNQGTGADALIGEDVEIILEIEGMASK